MSCKKGGVVTIRQNKIRDLTAKVVSDVCKDKEMSRNYYLLLERSFMKSFKIDKMKQDSTLEHVDFGKELSRHFSI